jgi:chemotaxis protein CheC
MKNIFDQEFDSILINMANQGICNAARGISYMVGEDLAVTAPFVRQVPLAEITNLLGGPETEAVGIYLRAYGQMSGQLMLVVPYLKGLELADLIMGVPKGTTCHLGTLERSALAELGNLTGTYFLNALADLTGADTRPSPPAVIVDMVGAILDILLTSSEGLSETVPMIQANFLRSEQEVQASFWVIPDRCTLDAIRRREIT